MRGRDGAVDARHADQRARRRRRALHQHPRPAEVGRELLHRQGRRPGRPEDSCRRAACSNDGKTLPYAWGLQIGEYRGLPIVEHSGSLGGYRAHILRFPSQHTSVALLCNASAIAPTTLARRVADVVLRDRFTAPGRHRRRASPAACSGPRAGRRRPPSRQPRVRRARTTARSWTATFTVIARGDELLVQREPDAAAGGHAHGRPTDHFRAAA